MTQQPRVVIITGMSGAGKTATAKVLEDLGYSVTDNLPPPLIRDLIATANIQDEPGARLGVVMDARRGVSFDQLQDALVWMATHGIRTTVLYLDADDGTLIRRFEETRRRHPVDAATLGEAIAFEREMLEGLRGEADIIIDTTDLNVHELRERLLDAFAAGEPRRRMQVAVGSFGFKRGIPRVLDLLFDVRFLPNPHWVEDLRPQTGLDGPVRAYVLGQPDTVDFLRCVGEMLDFLLPRYEAEGKSHLTIGIGCTGGRHRSVAIAEELGRMLRGAGIDASVSHRDLARPVREPAP